MKREDEGCKCPMLVDQSLGFGFEIAEFDSFIDLFDRMEERIEVINGFDCDRGRFEEDRVFLFQLPCEVDGSA